MLAASEFCSGDRYYQQRSARGTNMNTPALSYMVLIDEPHGNAPGEARFPALKFGAGPNGKPRCMADTCMQPHKE